MNCKTILKNIFSNLRKNRIAMLLFFASFFSIWSFQMQAQTLKTGSQLVELHACSEAKEFSVRIAKGSTECTNGTLKIDIPYGFELIEGSVKVDAINATMITESINGGIVELPTITAGPITDEVIITFYVKAVCDVIGIPAAGNVIQYTFSGCGNTTPQTGTSETINIRYAVLRVSVSPNPIYGIVGDEVERTVTILNQGNGEIPVVSLERNLGMGLTHLGYDFTSAAGWEVDATDVNHVIFTDSYLKSGQTITFTEKVKIEACALMPTNYEVYYGCAVKCERSSVNGTARHIINIKVADAPQLEVKADAPKAACFNGLVTQTWTITNTGGTGTSVLEFEIGTNDLGGYINPNTIKVDGVLASALDNSSNEPQHVKFSINGIPVNGSVEVTFEQFLSAPDGNAADCASAPTSFTNNNNYYSASYSFSGGCAPITVNGEVTKEVTYSFDGKHIGEIDIFTGENFEADFLFKNFKIPFVGLAPGDSFSVVINLSPDLSIPDSNAISITLNGNTITAIPTGVGSEYKLTFTYGTAPWNLNTDLNLSTARLKFPIELDCPITSDLWYRVGGELNKKDDAGANCSSIVFNCKQTELKGYCQAGPCTNGLQNGTASLNRVSLGYKVDASGTPNISVLADPTDVQIRTFILGDFLELSQVSKVVIAPGESFTKVRMVVEKDFNTTTSLVLTSGMVKVIRNGADHLFTDLTVTEVGLNYVLEFDASGKPELNDEFLNTDDIRLSFQVKVLGANDELAKFPTKSYLVRGSDALQCGRDYTATGFYVPVSYKFDGGTVDFVNCVDDTNTATFSTTVFALDRQDAIFTQEFRKLFRATKATLNVPTHLEMTAVKVVVKNQPWLGVNNFQVVAGLTTSGTEYVLELEPILNIISGNALFDEGFVLEIIPTVSLLGCEPVINEKELKVGIKLEGFEIDGEGKETSFSETKDLVYNTGIGTLAMELSNGEPLGTFNPQGTHVSWVVKVGSSGARNFNSVWIAKDSGVLGIESIVPVSDYNGGSPAAALTADVNNLYQLGDFATGSSRYYLITSKVIDCKVNDLVLVSGYNCASNTYPANSNSGCGLETITLTHEELKDNLQTTIVDASNQNNQQDFCEDLWYKIQIHNAGDTQAKDLTVEIPLETAPGLVFREFKFSNVFHINGSTPTDSDFVTGTIYSVDPSTNILTLTLPGSVTLNTLEDVQVIVIFDIENCDFRSGAKLEFIGLGNNVCDAKITNLEPATSKRIIIEGGSTSFPELETIHHEVVLDPVLSVGAVLRANYNFELKNSGQFGNTDEITSEYRFAVKLPIGWSIVGNPQDYIQPAGKVQYVGIDQSDNRGYIYKVTQGVVVGESIRLINVPLKYTVSNEIALDCAHDFGMISVMVFQNIDVSNCSSPSCPKGIDQVLLEDFTPMILPVDGILQIDPPQQTRIICNPLVSGQIPTLQDVTFTNGYYLSWYENEQEAVGDNPVNRLPLTTPLVHNRTYYVINRFIADGTCKSNIGEIKVLLNSEVLTASAPELVCAPDQKRYTVKVTLDGVAPFTVSGTNIVGTIILTDNEWISEPIAEGTDYAFTFTDAENCTPLVVQGDAPVCCTLQIDCPNAVTVSCEQGYGPEITGIPTIITSCGNTSYTYSDGPISVCVIGERSFTRTFTVTDASGNVETCTQVISIKDVVAPIFNGALPVDVTVSCASEVPMAEQMTAIDNCGNASVTFVQSAIVPGTCVNKYSFTRTWTATDSCGNTTEHMQTITVNDEIAPVISTNAKNKKVQCSAAGYQAELNAWLANNGGAIATDNCGDVTWSNNSATTPFVTTCGNAGSVTVVFTATDACGNASTTTATFTVEDTTKPVFTSPMPTDVTYSCSAEVPTALTFTATDGCSETPITAVLSETRVDNGACANSYVLTRTWTATDACGNAVSHTQTINVADTIKPVFTTLPQNKVVECDGKGNLDGPEGFHAWLASNAGAVATDNCGTVTITHIIEDTNTICGGSGTIIVDFIATDECGNFTIKQATYAIFDRTAPTMDTQPVDLEIECGDNIEDELNAWLSNNGGAIATDVCGLMTWEHNYIGKLSVCGAPIKVIFTVTDACGNFTNSNEVEVRLVDTVVPVLTKEAQSVTVECSANTEQVLENWLASHAGAEAADACSIVVWTNDYDKSKFPTACSATDKVTVIFTATDACGNEIATTATFTIEDTTAPTFVGQLPVERMTVSCDVVPATPILVATDNCGEAVISFTEKRVGGLCANSYDLVRVWTATDSCGNATSFTQTITVEDKVAPEFTTLPENITVECDGQGNTTDFQDWLTTYGNAVATDNCSDANKLVWTSEVVNTSVLCGKTGNTVVKFTVTDECGNASSKQATFTIEDTVSPSIDTPAVPLVIECGTNVDAQITTWLNNHGGAEASEVCGSVTWTHNYNGLTAACGNTGNATVVFTATDSCGNTEITSATITVEDTLKPALIKEAQGLTVECGTNTKQALDNWLANYGGAEAADSCSIVVWTNDYDDSKFPIACSATDTVTVIFTATDACNNEVTTTATFTVVDTEGPKFVGTLPVVKMTVSCDVVPATPILVATDNCGEAVISFTEKRVGGLCANSYDLVRVWTATDSCGNATNFTQTITVEDKVAPTFVENLPTNVTVSCSNDVPTAVTLTAIDNCGTADVVMTEARVDGSCANNYVLRRTWVATDACGNSTSHTQIIKVEDKIAPIFSGNLPANITVSCLGDLPADSTITATDNCGIVDVVLKETRVDGACANSFVLTKTWTATDECGNSVSHTQIITVDDKVAPVFVTVPQNVTVECDGQGNEADFNAWIATYADAEATDNCSTTDKLVWTTEIVNTSVLCGKTGNTVVKFTVIDECGNSVSKQAVFTIIDTTAPDFHVEAQDKTVACDGNGNANDLAAWLANHGGAKALDACSNTVTWTNDFTGLDKACGSTGSATVTFTATDSCGNTSDTTATFTIVDNEAPVFTTNLPHDLTLECSASIPEAAVINAVDACSTAEVVFTEERINGSCLGSYELVRTWTATDSCGNATSHVQTITIEDTTAPVFVDPLPVAELYMNCEDVQDAESLKAVDSCGTVDVTFTEETIAGDCSNRYTLVRTWTATDSCGNETVFVQDIHVACKIEFTNAISANGDGVNDEFQLKGIECYPGNTVEIFNRWGKLVYSTTNYNSNGNVFKGYANTKHVVSSGEKLPTGTYFYVVKYDFSLGNGTTQAMDQSGYIHLESNK